MDITPVISNNKTVLCIAAFNQIWIAMITIMMNNNNYYLLP